MVKINSTAEWKEHQSKSASLDAEPLWANGFTSLGLSSLIRDKETVLILQLFNSKQYQILGRDWRFHWMLFVLFFLLGEYIHVIKIRFIFWILCCWSQKPEVFGDYALFFRQEQTLEVLKLCPPCHQAEVGIPTLSGEVGVQALQGTDVRYLCAFSEVEIPTLDRLTLSNVYQPQGQRRKGLCIYKIQRIRVFLYLECEQQFLTDREMVLGSVKYGEKNFSSLENLGQLFFFESAKINVHILLIKQKFIKCPGLEQHLIN